MQRVADTGEEFVLVGGPGCAAGLQAAGAVLANLFVVAHFSNLFRSGLIRRVGGLGEKRDAGWL